MSWMNRPPAATGRPFSFARKRWAPGTWDWTRPASFKEVSQVCRVAPALNERSRPHTVFVRVDPMGTRTELSGALPRPAAAIGW